MTHEETMEMYEPGDTVKIFDSGEWVRGTVKRVQGGTISVTWNDIDGECIHHEDEFAEIKNITKQTAQQWDNQPTRQ